MYKSGIVCHECESQYYFLKIKHLSTLNIDSLYSCCIPYNSRKHNLLSQELSNYIESSSLSKPLDGLYMIHG